MKKVDISKLNYELVYKAVDKDTETTILNSTDYKVVYKMMYKLYVDWLKSNGMPRYTSNNECSVYIEIDVKAEKVVRWWIKVFDNGEELTLTMDLLHEILAYYEL